MRPAFARRLSALGLGVGLLLVGVFVTLVIRYGHELRHEIRQRMIERDAAVLYPVVQQQIEADDRSGNTSALSLRALLPHARRDGLIAMAIFDESGIALDQVPSDQLLVELPFEDFLRLQNGRPLTRFHPAFSTADLFPGTSPAPPFPVLEILLPLRVRSSHPTTADQPIGFVRYHLDARALERKLTALDRRVFHQTAVTLGLGVFSIGAILAAAFFVLRRAQHTIAQRNEQLVRANFELSLAAKASALGQITSHLIHGLQGSVAGLRAVVSSRENPATPDWQTAADYTERMQAMIQDAVALLGDHASAASYELTDHELVDLVRRRNLPVARKHNVTLEITGGFDHPIDSHRGGLLCLIINNLVDNAIHASPSRGTVHVMFRNGSDRVTILVSDEGHGISDTLRPHLFEPGRSGRPGGSGLGLAISRLLARQINATLRLDSTSAIGTTFRLTLPLHR